MRHHHHPILTIAIWKPSKFVPDLLRTLRNRWSHLWVLRTCDAREMHCGAMLYGPYVMRGLPSWVLGCRRNQFCDRCKCWHRCECWHRCVWGCKRFSAEHLSWVRRCACFTSLLSPPDYGRCFWPSRQKNAAITWWLLVVRSVSSRLESFTSALQTVLPHRCFCREHCHSTMVIDLVTGHTEWHCVVGNTRETLMSVTCNGLHFPSSMEIEDQVISSSSAPIIEQNFHKRALHNAPILPCRWVSTSVCICLSCSLGSRM